MVDPALMERTADALLAVVVEQDMPLDKVRETRQIEKEPTICTCCALQRGGGKGGDAGWVEHGVYFLSSAVCRSRRYVA